MEDPTALVDRPGNRYAQARYIFLAALAGVLTGTIGSFFHLFIDHLLLWPEQLSKVVKGPLLVISAALITCAITVLSVFFVKRYAPEAGGSGVQEIEGAMQGLRQVRWKRILPVKFLTGVGALSSGLVLGREGPTIHIGASIAEATTDFFRVSDVERRGMLGAGAAAGLACAFNAPLAAILFIVEETHKQFPYTFRTYMGVIVAALLSTVMTEVIGGKAPDFAMSVATPDLILLPAFVVLGCVLGLIGVTLNAGLMRTTAFAAELHKKVPYLFPAIIGLAVGALFILMPLSVTGGEHIINIVGHNPPALTLSLIHI